MKNEFIANDWDSYRMQYDAPHCELEPLEREIEVVDNALKALRARAIIAKTVYDHGLMLAHRQAVRELFDIPWTAISPRMQRLIYAVNAIVKPVNMIAAGIFCGNTFISNAGAGVGPGACYEAEDLIGIEIDPERAALAERNVRKIDPTGTARILAENAIETCSGFDRQINLLYLDADGTPDQGKGVYLDILEASLDKMSPGSVVLAHNSINCADRLKHYLEFVRDPSNFRASLNMKIDPEGLEISVL